MATNKILPWAQTGTANVLSDDAYAADVATGGLYGDGVKTGQASSQQANKTWRQATAPGSGLGQFLVDNLSVDVTDADTPATFSTRIANAILKLAQISPFNQSFAAAIGGYRKYAIVSDSSGNFWVSTADQNVTVPGASGAKWKNLFNGYATEAWSNNAFVQSQGAGIHKLSAATIDAGLSVPSFKDGAGVWHQVQPYGDYATNTALQSEASSRASADTDLQNQVSNRVVKTGDVMTGGLTIEGGGGFAAQYNPGSPASGTYINYPGFTSITEGRGGEFHMSLQEHVGDKFSGLFSLKLPDGSWRYVSIPQGSRIIDSQFGDVAYTSDLGNYQPKGSYVTTDTYSSDFSTSDSRVINLAYGHRIQVFTVTATNLGRITFPTAFSGPPTHVNIEVNQNIDCDHSYVDADANGFTVHLWSGGNITLSIMAIGPK